MLNSEGLEAIATCDNYTETLVSDAFDGSLATFHILVAGTVAFFLILPIVLFQFTILPIGTTSAILLGAVLMVVTGVVGQQEVYQVLGKEEHLSTVFLLLGMMLLANYFEREQLLIGLLRRILNTSMRFESYLFRVCLITFILSAFFTNDACCAIFTPLLMKFWQAQERSFIEVEFLAIGIATSANIGSVTTIFGNPQMAIIAATTSTPMMSRSRVDLRVCLIYLGLPAIVVFITNLAFLILAYRIRCHALEKTKRMLNITDQSVQEMSGLTQKPKTVTGNGIAGLINNCVYEETRVKSATHLALETIPEDDVLEITSTSLHESDASLNHKDSVTFEIENEDSTGSSSDEDNDSLSTSQNLNSLDIDYKPSALQSSNSATSTGSVPDNYCILQRKPSDGVLVSSRYGLSRSSSAISAADFLTSQDRIISWDKTDVFISSDSVIFQTVLIIVVIFIIALFIASSNGVYFDIGLVPIAGAAIVITADAILNHNNAMFIIKRVDWSIIVLFFSLFVWIHGFNKTRIPHWLWDRLGLNLSSNAFMDPVTLTIFITLIVFGSNIISNVPLVILVLDQLAPCADQKAIVLFLAWSATIAGNLTLFGSVANLIVAETTLDAVNYRLKFFTFLRFGLLTTIFHIVIGLLIIYGLLLL